MSLNIIYVGIYTRIYLYGSENTRDFGIYQFIVGVCTIYIASEMKNNFMWHLKTINLTKSNNSD